MRQLLAFTAALLTLGALTAAPAQASTTSDSSWGRCNKGNTCLFDGRDGRFKFWTAPDCGFYNLGEFDPPINDRLTSIRNPSEAYVELYDWDGYSEWIHVRTIRPYSKANLRSWENNRVDAVKIDC